MKILLAFGLLLLQTLSVAQAQNSNVIAAGAMPVKLESGFKFSEGPVSDAAGNLYFTDVSRSRVHIWPLNGPMSLFRSESNGANGLDFDADGNLILCEGRAKRVTSLSPDGTLTILADTYDGKKLNSPNDVWVSPNGGIYFTDPHFGKSKNRSQDGGHVYFLTPEKSSLIRVTTDLKQPNGVVGTPDGKRVYVSDNKLGATFVFDAKADGRLGPKRLFVSENSDGMTLDERGNLYLSWYDGVRIFDPSGALVAKIEIPGFASNVAFGGNTGKTLYITAKHHLYSIEMDVTGARMQN
jgi:gluconolactonase